MDYWHALTVPVGRAIGTPLRETMGVCPGVVKGVWVFFPKGCAGTTHLRIISNEHQVWPTNPDGWYLGDGTVIEFSEEYPIEAVPYEFHIEGYNTSTTNPHTVYVRLTVLPSSAIVPPVIVGRAVEGL